MDITMKDFFKNNIIPESLLNEEFGNVNDLRDYDKTIIACYAPENRDLEAAYEVGNWLETEMCCYFS